MSPLRGHAASALSAKTALLLLAGAALLLLPTLGLYPLFDVDEGAFSEATRELLHNGDWLSTTLNGAPRYDKPILIYWLQALSVGALGLDEFALRLPSALAGLAWILAIAVFAAPRLGRDTAWRAGWIAATSLGVMAMSRTATADALLNALLAAMMLDLWRHLERGDAAALRRGYLWMALGVLTKGPIAILIPLVVSLTYCALARRWRDWLRAVADPLGWLILLAVAGPWYLAQLFLHGREFIDGFILRHNVDRFAGTLEGHGGGVWYYLALLPVLMLPWSGLLWPLLRGLRAQWHAPLARYLWLWFGFVFAFFSVSGTKLPHYLLYGMTPLFLLAAQHLREPGRRMLLVLPCLMGVLLLALPGIVQWLTQPMLPTWLDLGGLQESLQKSLASPRYAYYVAQASRATALAGGAYYAVTAGAALALLGLAAYRPWPPERRALAGAGVLAAALGFAVVPWLGALLSGPVKEAGRMAAQLPGQAVQWNIAAPSFSVYRGQITPARPPEPGEMAITRIDRLDPQVPVEILYREGGVALVRRR